MPGPRDYKRSAIFALATLGQGTCYWPEPPCRVPAIVYIQGEPVINLEIAHIRAAERNGPRYDPAMTDNERRSWQNLILLCTPHHNLIDKIKPGDYPIEKLATWKSDRERGNLVRLRGLHDLTEDRLQEILTYSINEAYKEIRDVLAQQRQIDPEIAMLVTEAARNLNMVTAEMLSDAADRLAPALYEYGEILSRSATDLRIATEELPGLLSQLDDRINELRNLGDM